MLSLPAQAAERLTSLAASPVADPAARPPAALPHYLSTLPSAAPDREPTAEGIEPTAEGIEQLRLSRPDGLRPAGLRTGASGVAAGGSEVGGCGPAGFRTDGDHGTAGGAFEPLDGALKPPDGAPSDAMLAIHAWRSAGAIEQYHEVFPTGPLILCLAGTDIYRFQESHPEETLRSMELADLLVCLHDLVGHSIPKSQRSKLHVIRQSAAPLKRQKPLV